MMSFSDITTYFSEGKRKKSLKIPNQNPYIEEEQTTHNTMAKRKTTKGQTTINKIKIE